MLSDKHILAMTPEEREAYLTGLGWTDYDDASIVKVFTEQVAKTELEQEMFDFYLTATTPSAFTQLSEEQWFRLFLKVRSEVSDTYSAKYENLKTLAETLIENTPEEREAVGRMFISTGQSSMAHGMLNFMCEALRTGIWSPAKTGEMLILFRDNIQECYLIMLPMLETFENYIKYAPTGVDYIDRFNEGQLEDFERSKKSFRRMLRWFDSEETKQHIVDNLFLI